MTTATTTATLNLTGAVFDRIVGAVVGFTQLGAYDMQHDGGVPWVEFVKIHATGSSVYAMAGDGLSLGIARNRRSCEPVEFLLHADDARDLLAMEFERIEFTARGELLEVTVSRNSRPWLLELPTRRPETFPSMQRLVASAFENRGDKAIALSGRVLDRLLKASAIFGLDSGLVIYPRDNAGASVVAAFRDELLLVCGINPTAVRRLDDRTGQRGNGTAKGHDTTWFDPAEFWTNEITEGTW